MTPEEAHALRLLVDHAVRRTEAWVRADIRARVFHESEALADAAALYRRDADRALSDVDIWLAEHSAD